ncbi:hypothetical protein PRZ48_014544 [Zasmidium cellare]|uniref:Uncharacterized protein n=1 Tax=Zasmidium cellare TaxID=395010 RepID=A0ABR0DZ80_ZASCE|nr:hypothetical protein PRZ48_014544 [Zasmidium cellare]
MARNEVDSLMRRLQTDKFVMFHTMENPTAPYLVPRSLLAGQSDYFDTRMQNNQWMFTFKGDQAEIWKTYLHWLVEKKLREDIFAIDGTPDLESAAACYALGEQYGLKAFQDEVMLYILHWADSCDSRGEWLVADGVLVAFQHTSGGSKLRHLLVEEAVHEQGSNGLPFGMGMDTEEVLKLEDLGFFPLFINKWAHGDCPDESRFGDKCEAEYSWKNYMVGPAEKYEAARLKQAKEAEEET